MSDLYKRKARRALELPYDTNEAKVDYQPLGKQPVLQERATEV